MGDQGFAEHSSGSFPRLVRRADELDAPTLAAPAGVDLRLDDREWQLQLGEGIGSRIGGRNRDALGYGHAVLSEQLLGLILVDFHAFNFATGSSDSAPGRKR